jgi:hypothetical protein
MKIWIPQLKNCEVLIDQLHLLFDKIKLFELFDIEHLFLQAYAASEIQWPGLSIR